MNKNYLVVQCFGVNVAFIDVMVSSIKKKDRLTAAIIFSCSMNEK